MQKVLLFILLSVAASVANAQHNPDGTWDGHQDVDCAYATSGPASPDKKYRCQYAGVDPSFFNPKNTYAAFKIGNWFYGYLKEYLVNPITDDAKTMVSRFPTPPFPGVGVYTNYIGFSCIPFTGRLHMHGVAYYKTNDPLIAQLWPDQLGGWIPAAGDRYNTLTGSDEDCPIPGESDPHWEIIINPATPDLSNHDILGGIILLPDEDGNGQDEGIIIARGALCNPVFDGPDCDDYQIYNDCGTWACDQAAQETIVINGIGGAIEVSMSGRSFSDSAYDPLGWTVGQEYGAIFRRETNTHVFYDLVRFFVEPTAADFDTGEFRMGAGDFSHTTVYSYEIPTQPDPGDGGDDTEPCIFCGPPDL